MFIYSKKIFQFIDEIKNTIRTVLTKEIGLKVTGSRFYNRQENCSYPIKIVIYNEKSMLGYFDSSFYELGFHERLMHSKKELHNVIRHELAHYMTFINYGTKILPHGLEFKAFCEQMGWEKEVYKATSCIEDDPNIFETEESVILRKVKKLMALSTSSNQNEAEQAMIKSQQLLLKYNIESTYIDGEDDEKTYLKRIMKQKKQDAKMRAIANILETFFVNRVYHRDKEFTFLEILGTKVNVEIAEYVATILDIEFEKLWIQARLEANLKGIIAKNSFFIGIAKGYCNKIKALKKEYNSDIKNMLMVIEKQLVDAAAMVYPRLSSSKSQASYCMESSALGEKMGRQLNINPGLSQSSKNSGMLISYQN